MKRVNITKEEVDKIKKYWELKKITEEYEAEIRKIKEKYMEQAQQEGIELIYRNTLVGKILMIETTKLELPLKLREELKKKYGVKERQIRLIITLPSPSSSDKEDK
jgi:hypothetical protein